MATEEREFTDGVTLEEIDVLLDDVAIYTAQNVTWKIEQAKKLEYGAGKRKSFGRTRGHKVYTVSMDVVAVNQALLRDPADYKTGQGEIKSFEINGVVYTNLCDIRNATLTLSYTDQDGTRIRRRFKGFEFNSDQGELSLENAEGRTLEGEATEAEGLV